MNNTITYTFPQALELLLQGHSVTRLYWDCFNIGLIKGNIAADYPGVEEIDYKKDPYFILPNSIHHLPSDLFEVGDYGTGTRMPRFECYNSHDKTTSIWTPRIEDIFANDWTIVPEVNILNFDNG